MPPGYRSRRSEIRVLECDLHQKPEWPRSVKRLRPNIAPSFERSHARAATGQNNVGGGFDPRPSGPRLGG
jgi:hypothetical protein